MSHPSDAPAAHEIVTLGALAQVPDFVNEEDDATTNLGFGVFKVSSILPSMSLDQLPGQLSMVSRVVICSRTSLQFEASPR